MRAVLDSRAPGADQCRQRRVVRFDFVRGKYELLPEVAAVKRHDAVRVRLQGAGVATPRTAALRKMAKAGAAGVPEVSARLSVEADHVALLLRVGGREALSFGAAKRSARTPPPRQSALGAAASLAQSERELEQALEQAEADEKDRREAWRLAQELEAERAQKEEMAQKVAVAEEAAQEAAREAAAAAQSAATERAAAERTAAEQQAAARQLAAERLERQKEGSMKALELAREREREWRARAATFEQQLYDERRQPDVRVRSENAQALAARREAEQKAARLEVENAKLAKGHARMSKALEQERTNRKSWQSAAFEAEEQAVAPATYYWLLATCYLLLTTCYLLLPVTFYLLYAGSRRSAVAR